MADTGHSGVHQRRLSGDVEGQGVLAGGVLCDGVQSGEGEKRESVADTTVAGREARRTNGMGDADGPRRDEGQSSGTHRQGARIFRTPFSGEWEPEPELGRVADGIPSRVDRLRGLGNAVVPQIVTEIAKRLAEEMQDAL